MNLAAGYARISKQDQSQYSLSYQERMIREYCDRNGLTLKAIFTDNGESSYTFDRADFRALEVFLKKNRDVKFLIFLEASRFSRNVAEALTKLRELEEKMKIRVYATTDVFGTDFSDPSAFIMRTLQYVMGESELHNIRKRTRAGMLQGALSGRFMTTAPFGYRNARDSRNKAILEIVEAEARLVRLIFKDFLGGMGQAEIARKVKELGFTRRGKMAITSVLANGVYAGLIPIPAHKDRQTRFVQGLHVPIISEVDYWLVQERLIQKPKVFGLRPEVPLRGVLRCWCGKKMTAGNSKSRNGKYHWYYQCMTHRENLPATKLHPKFTRLLEHLSLDQKRIDNLRQRLTEDIGQKLRGRDGEITTIERELKRLRMEIKTMELRYLKGGVREETFKELVTGLQANESRLQDDLAAASLQGPAYYAAMMARLELLSNLSKAYDHMPPEKKQQFILQAFGNHFYYRENSYRTTFLHPAFAHNALTLKEKELLMVEKPTKALWGDPDRGALPGTYTTPLAAIADLLALIA